jgi:hypothetical protein
VNPEDAEEILKPMRFFGTKTMSLMGVPEDHSQIPDDMLVGAAAIWGEPSTSVSSWAASSVDRACGHRSSARPYKAR